jgi:hypothetical protein
MFHLPCDKKEHVRADLINTRLFYDINVAFHNVPQKTAQLKITEDYVYYFTYKPIALKGNATFPHVKDLRKFFYVRIFVEMGPLIFTF